jgi:hypothetical protein
MSQETKKIVNIYPTMPITRVTPPLRTVAKNVSRPISYIRSCIMSRAMVDEVLPDGTTVRLGLHNYDKNNYVVADNTDEESAVKVNDDEVLTDDTSSDIAKDTETEAEVTVENTKSAWDIAYENALADKDLSSMTKKQRKDAKAEARAIADATVNPATDVEESVETSEETPIVEDVTVEGVVETADAEDLTAVTE